MPIYFDQASSSFPKPEVVAKAVYDTLLNNSISINRSSNRQAYELESMVYDARDLINKFFNGYGVEKVTFTKNITESLNLVIRGLLKDGDHVIISPIEHNAVYRPVYSLSKSNIEFSCFDCDIDGRVNFDSIKKSIKHNTKAIICTHASNVSGTILPIKEIGEVARKNNILFIVDSAQTAGILPIDMKEENIDILCFTGHKGLMGPQGIGGILFKDDIFIEIDPLIFGGTGSLSSDAEMPKFLPDKYEAGTQNTPAIMGLKKSIEWINSTGIETILSHELNLTKLFLNEIKKIEDYKVIGPNCLLNRLGIVSLTAKKDLAIISQELEDRGIITRVGLHCAPLAHKTFGTFPKGTLRFSFGYFNTKEEVKYTIEVLRKLI